MWQANNYTGLSSVTITLFLYPFISSHNVRNCSKCWLVARGGDDYSRRKQQQLKTLNAKHIAACRGIIQTVPYYGVFQQLVICLIGALELNGIIIKTETDRGRRGHCGHILNETSMFWGRGDKKISCVDSRRWANSHLETRALTPGSLWETWKCVYLQGDLVIVCLSHETKQ